MTRGGASGVRYSNCATLSPGHTPHHSRPDCGNLHVSSVVTAQGCKGQGWLAAVSGVVCTQVAPGPGHVALNLSPSHNLPCYTGALSRVTFFNLEGPCRIRRLSTMELVTELGEGAERLTGIQRRSLCRPYILREAEPGESASAKAVARRPSLHFFCNSSQFLLPTPH